MLQAFPETQGGQAIPGRNRPRQQAWGIGGTAICSCPATAATSGALLALRRLRNGVDTDFRSESRRRVGSPAATCRDGDRCNRCSRRRGVVVATDIRAFSMPSNRPGRFEASVQ
jgi:hypothetical protein